MKVNARSHCKESLQGVIARSHCKESWQGLQLALDSLHLQLALDSLHLQLDSMHLQLALDSMHLAPCTWLLALGSLHLAPCTCNLHLTPCTCDLHLTPCTWLLATCNGSHDSHNSRFFATVVVRTGPRELSRGSRACSRNRRVAGSIPPWSAGGRRKMQLAFCSNLRRATCAEQVAQSNLRRPTCTDQFAQSALPRATCAEQLTQSNLHRATCTEQLAQSNLQGAQFAQSNLQGPTCRSNLRGATCAEQLAQCNLRRATCADQLAPTSLRRAPCLVLSRACFTKCREKERILQRWADLACDVLLSGQPWSSFFWGGLEGAGGGSGAAQIICETPFVVWESKRRTASPFGGSPPSIWAHAQNGHPRKA